MARKLTVEDILSDELKREMNLDEKSFVVLDDWDEIMQSVYKMPIEYAGYTKKVADAKLLKEMIDTLASQDFDSVKRSESRNKQLAQFAKTMSMYYNLVFTKGKRKVGYGTLFHFPKLNKSHAERSSGIVLAAKIVEESGKRTSSFERAKFDDFLVEVKPYVNLLGDLYRQSRKM